MKSKSHYTAKEAQEILGMTYSALRNQVNAGHIHDFTPPGKRQAVYIKEDVDRLARELRAFMAARSKTASTFSKATKEDIPACARISDEFFGTHFDVKKQLAWLHKNPDICYVVKSEERVVGYILLLPLKAEKIEKLLREEEFALDIETDEVGEFKAGVPLDIYMASIAITPSVTLAEKRQFGARLIAGVMGVLIDMGRKGIILRTITARSSKPDGIRLLRGAGFTEILSTTDKKNFMIEVGKSGVKEITEYKKALKDSGVYSFPQDLRDLSGSVLPDNHS